MLTHIAVDQYGQKYPLVTKYPRKELSENYFPGRRIDKMYVDMIDGKTRHTGWVFGGQSGNWVTVWRVKPLNDDKRILEDI